MVVVPSSTNTSTDSSLDRQQRISAFKLQISTLRATSKVYNIYTPKEGDDSIHTLDSTLGDGSTVASSSLVAKRAEVGSNSLPSPSDGLAVQQEEEEQKRSPIETTSGMSYDKRISNGSSAHNINDCNPFFGSSSEEEEEEEVKVQAEARSKVKKAQSNPLHDSSDDDENEMNRKEESSVEDSSSIEALSLGTIDKELMKKMEAMNMMNKAVVEGGGKEVTPQPNKPDVARSSNPFYDSLSENDKAEIISRQVSSQVNPFDDSSDEEEDESEVEKVIPNPFDDSSSEEGDAEATLSDTLEKGVMKKMEAMNQEVSNVNHAQTSNPFIDSDDEAEEPVEKKVESMKVNPQQSNPFYDSSDDEKDYEQYEAKVREETNNAYSVLSSNSHHSNSLPPTTSSPATPGEHTQAESSLDTQDCEIMKTMEAMNMELMNAELERVNNNNMSRNESSRMAVDPPKPRDEAVSQLPQRVISPTTPGAKSNASSSFGGFSIESVDEPEEEEERVEEQQSKVDLPSIQSVEHEDKDDDESKNNDGGSDNMTALNEAITDAKKEVNAADDDMTALNEAIAEAKDAIKKNPFLSDSDDEDSVTKEDNNQYAMPTALQTEAKPKSKPARSPVADISIKTSDSISTMTEIKMININESSSPGSYSRPDYGRRDSTQRLRRVLQMSKDLVDGDDGGDSPTINVQKYSFSDVEAASSPDGMAPKPDEEKSEAPAVTKAKKKKKKKGKKKHIMPISSPSIGETSNETNEPWMGSVGVGGPAVMEKATIVPSTKKNEELKVAKHILPSLDLSDERSDKTDDWMGIVSPATTTAEAEEVQVKEATKQIVPSTDLFDEKSEETDDPWLGSVGPMEMTEKKDEKIKHVKAAHKKTSSGLISSDLLDDESDKEVKEKGEVKRVANLERYKSIPSTDMFDDESTKESDQFWLKSWNNINKEAAAPDRQHHHHQRISSVPSNFTETYLADVGDSSSAEITEIQPPAEASTDTDDEKSKSSQSNPFAELLRIRQMRKMALKRVLHHQESIGTIDLEDTSNEDTSMSSKSLFKDGDNNFPRVYCNEEEDGSAEASLEGLLFSDLKKALSTLPSVSIEESDMEAEKSEKPEKANRTPLRRSEAVTEESVESVDNNVHTKTIVVKDTGTIISSLKDETYLILNTGVDVDSQFNDDPFEDDLDEISSVPKSPAAIETSSDRNQMHVLNRTTTKNNKKNISLKPNPFDDSCSEEGEAEESLDSINKQILKEIEAMNKKNAAAERKNKVADTLGFNPFNDESSSDDDDSVAVSTLLNKKAGDDSVDTVTHANSPQPLYHKFDDRSDHALIPPKKDVVIRSDGSISTKDSILGKTINVANSDLIAERIYLESLRAQVLAELKVHVADEEIRLALDARLSAIQDYYKRKATVVSLSAREKTPALSLGDLPKVKPTLVHDKNIEDPPKISGNAALSYPQQRQDSHKFAFERVQNTIEEAIRAAHNQSPRESTYVPGNEDNEEAERKNPFSDDSSDSSEDDDEEEEEEEKEEEVFTRQTKNKKDKSSVPFHITFWDDDDDPYSPLESPAVEAVGSTREIVLRSSQVAAPLFPEVAPPGEEGNQKLTHTQTIHKSWSYYRGINSLLFDSRVYDYEFQQIQNDPLYPYLNSLMGIADGGDDGNSHEYKRISQQVKSEYDDMSPERICHTLATEAKYALPELKEICAYIGNKLGMQTMAVGPMKKPSDALLKADRKYGGDPLLVTDYCRVSLFVKDISSLLALIEIVLSKYAGIVRRIKLSSLKADHVPLVGGYRDCKINFDIGGHICEVQVHLVSMWLIMEGKGYTHYRKCSEHHVDISSFDIQMTLKGLKRKTLVDLIKMGEHELKEYPIVSLAKYNEPMIRDYFALASMYLYYGKPSTAELILRRTAKLRSESSEFGLCHAETLLHLELLLKTLKAQHKYKSASSIKSQIRKIRKAQKKINGEDEDQELCTANHCGAMDYVCEMIMDPSKKERQEEKAKADIVEDSRALWLVVRKSFFS